MFTERGVYRTGETVFATALLRDANGAAIAGVPLTLVVRRPDGVEYRRAMVEDQGLGGRVLPVLILPGAMRGTWRIAAYTDPKGAAGEASFLVEDYVPERLECETRTEERLLMPGQPAEIDFSARYLFGAPGADLEVSGEVVVGASEGHGIKGLEGFAVGLDDEQVEASPSRSRRKPRPMRRGRDAAGADPGGGGPSAYGGAHHAAGCRVGRPGGRAQRDAADPAGRPRDRRAQEFRRRTRRGLDRHVRRGARLTDGRRLRGPASAGAS